MLRNPFHFLSLLSLFFLVACPLVNHPTRHRIYIESLSSSSSQITAESSVSSNVSSNVSSSSSIVSSCSSQSPSSSSSSSKMAFWVAPSSSSLPKAPGTEGECTLPESLDPDSFFVDTRDCQIYRQVKIGTQTWMAENLKFDAGSTSECYENNPNNCKTFGRLYSWITANGLTEGCIGNPCRASLSEPHQGICPAGWHIPTLAEMDSLWTWMENNGHATQVDLALKATDYGVKGAYGYDAIGFHAIPSGQKSSIGVFNGYLELVNFWALNRYEPTEGNIILEAGVVWSLFPGSRMPSTHPESIESKNSLRCVLNP